MSDYIRGPFPYKGTHLPNAVEFYIKTKPSEPVITIYIDKDGNEVGRDATHIRE